MAACCCSQDCCMNVVTVCEDTRELQYMLHATYIHVFHNCNVFDVHRYEGTHDIDIVMSIILVHHLDIRLYIIHE